MYSLSDDRIAPAGFPHSEIPGSLDIRLLPEAYRSRSRLSSPSSAKASTCRPFHTCYSNYFIQYETPCDIPYRPFLPYSIVKELFQKERPSLHLDDAAEIFSGTTKSKFSGGGGGD